ncbi:uncharacterized protein LOC113240576 [Hyposmocoma kahamanoa]|uniref:uncharacterized protein LOC113240576 n=1 Tax=Hyposmocoma kahamanoa TaxID=1477025 RepID=UPI000E6D860C|nr:uncharacterized protein LOC113240576 [Hyposmocoma kahamanoa]
MLGNLRIYPHVKHWNCVIAVSNQRSGQILNNIVEYQKRTCSKGPPCKCKDGKPLPAVCPDQKIPECCKDEEFFKYQMRGKDRLEKWPKPEMPHGNWHFDCPQTPQPTNYDPYRIKTPDILVPPLPKSNAKPMLVCAKQRGACVPSKAPDPPECPKPPKKPISFLYPLLLLAFCSFIGLEQHVTTGIAALIRAISNKEWFPPPDEDFVPPHIVHLYKNKGILSGILPEYLGEWAAEKVRCENVTMRPSVQVYDAFMSPDGDDKLELTLSDGSSLKTDYVFVAVGAEPRTDIALPSYLEVDHVNGGYLVNTELEARKDLYVAGDAASVYSQWKDTRIRMDHYHTAEQQGIIAGANMTGFWTPCNIEPHFWLRLKDDIQMEVVGEVGACMPTIGIFKPCDNDPLGRKYELKIGEFDKPCYKDTEEYRNRYKRGMLFYLRDEVVVGMLFWNFPPIEDRYEVCTEMLRARPTYKDINVLAELLGFEGLQCVYIPETEIKPPSPCIKNSKWMPYPEYDKIRELSNFEFYKGPLKMPSDSEVEENSPKQNAV